MYENEVFVKMGSKKFKNFCKNIAEKFGG